MSLFLRGNIHSQLRLLTPFSLRFGAKLPSSNMLTSESAALPKVMPIVLMRIPLLLFISSQLP